MKMTPASSPIAVVEGSDSDHVQQLLADAAARWRAGGARVAGVTARSRNLPGQVCRAGELRDVSSGRRFSIYLETAPQGTSCHVDAGGVKTACEAVIDDIAASDLIVLSKFGKLEAAGQGLFMAFQAAITAGKPLLTSVSARHRSAWSALAPVSALLPADTRALDAWWRAQSRP